MIEFIKFHTLLISILKKKYFFSILGKQLFVNYYLQSNLTGFLTYLKYNFPQKIK